MTTKIFNFNFLATAFITFYAFAINWMSGNLGVMPIDTFGFFDSGTSILHNKLPIRDFWVFTGILVDYFQAFFFLVFGQNWVSYILHASFINILISIVTYYFLISLNLKKSYALLYTLSFATLCYPVIGTPFAYLHSYSFSLLSIFLMCMGIIKKQNVIWFILPIFMFFAFLSMQTPSSYIIVIIIIFSIYYFIKEKNLQNFKFFVLGSIFCILVFFLFLFITKTPLKNFIYQYLLFPLTIGEGRLASKNSAFISLSDQLHFKRLILDFKFIHIFLLPLIVLTVKNLFDKFKNNRKNNLIFLNIIIIFSVILFIFNQLVTANQIYIFSLIPITAAILHINLNNYKNLFKLNFLIILILISVTTKYHLRYNVERKFQDLENKDLTKAVPAKNLSSKLKHLKWITPFYDDPNEEIKFLKFAANSLKKDTRNKIVITHYQFFSTILEEDLNILNRWYLYNNNTHPNKNHKYFGIYKDLVRKNVKNNKIEVIYLVGNEHEIPFEKVKNSFEGICFKNTILIKHKLSYHQIISCD